MSYSTENLVKEVNYLLDNAEEIMVFEIDFRQMPDLHDFKSTNRQEGFLGNLFKELDDKTKNRPVIYWFEADNRKIAEKYLDGLDTYRIDEKRWENYTNRKKETKRVQRVIPVKNNNQTRFPESKVLYVGKSEDGFTEVHKLSDISSRLIIHLGYYEVPTTQGLQFYHWARGMKDKLKLTILRLPNSIPDSKNQPKDYLSIIERLYALRLNPLCGKH